MARCAALTKRHEEAVTDADRASQRHIVAGLQRRFSNRRQSSAKKTKAATRSPSNAPIRAAEYGSSIHRRTNNFIAGLGNFAVCIGLLEKGSPLIGVVYDVTLINFTMPRAGKGPGSERSGCAPCRRRSTTPAC